MPDAHTVDSPDAGTTLLSFLASFDRLTRDRGAEYQRAGRVINVTRFDDKTVLGEVRGSKLYTVELLRSGKAWRTRCSCPIAVDCKHAVAVALQWLAQSRGGSPARSVVLAPAPPRVTFRQQWEPVLAEKIGRALTAEECVLLGKLSQIFHNFRQSGRVYAQDLARLGFGTAEAQRGYYKGVFEDWWQTPPRDPMELWQYIAYDLEASGLEVPEFLRPVTDTRAIRARLKDRVRNEAVLRWTERFKQLADQAELAAVPAESEAEGGPLELRLCISANGWRLETRSAAGASWSAAPRTFLGQLVRDDAALARVETSPAVYAFLALCQQHARLYQAVELQSRGPGASELLHRILSHRLARTLVVDPAGQPLVFADTPLVWQLARSAEDERDYELTLRLPDGNALPPGTPHLRGRPDFYLHGNTVYPGPPALDGASATGAIVPAEAIERAASLRMLHRFGTKLPPEIAARFVVVPMRARIECELVPGQYSGVETFQLRLFAVSDRPVAEQVFTHSGWAILDSEHNTRASESEKIVTFDLAAPNLAAARLADLKLTYAEFEGHWLRRVTKTFPEEFLAWREALPPEIEVLASGELASLLGAPVRAQVDFSLVESAVHRDWFDLALALKPEDTTLTPAEIALLLKARGKLVRLPGKGWRRLRVEIEGAPSAALEAAGFDRDSLAEAALSGERHRFHALQLSQGAIADLLPEREGEKLRARARAIALPQPAALPAGLRAELRPYQLEGFHFLAFLSANQLGGVLADDMGLGKTVQTLAWLLWLAQTGRGRSAAGPLRALVICPKSVVGNWEAETARFAPALRVARFAPKTMETLLSDAGAEPLIVVANYTQLRLAGDFFRAQRWHAVVLDEGQFIKTPGSKVAQIARELPGEHRIVLTGTPIENRLLDLWSLFSFALPGLLGTQAAFKRHYAQDNPLALTRLRGRVRHFLLRRTKAQVAADLPARTEEEVFVELEGEQRKLYDAELKRARAQLLKVETTRQLDKARFNILASLLRLRQICCHPALIAPAHAEAPSAKLEELLDRLEELRDEGHQVLVFSQFVEMLELIREKLTAAGIEHLMLTGQTEDREALVRRFQTEKQLTVFLLSLKAAGFGLNLTAASYVILYDPWWNPAVEAQAIDRTHRIGQTAPVNAYRLIARNTIEEKIRALQREKSALAGAIVQEESLASVLDLDSLRRILA